MPQHVINLLDNLLENGGDQDIKTLGEGVKATLEIVSDMDANVAEALDKINTHIKDKEQHTPKGILVRKDVITWFVGIVILISTIVAHAPELIARIVGAVP